MIVWRQRSGASRDPKIISVTGRVGTACHIVVKRARASGWLGVLWALAFLAFHQNGNLSVLISLNHQRFPESNDERGIQSYRQLLVG